MPYFVQNSCLYFGLQCIPDSHYQNGQASCPRLVADKQLTNKFISLSRHLKNDFCHHLLQSTETKLKATSQAKVMIPITDYGHPERAIFQKS